MTTKKGMYEGIDVLIALYGSEAWVLENKVKNRVDVAEMSCMGSMYGVTRSDRERNEEIRNMEDNGGDVGQGKGGWMNCNIFFF